MIAITESFGESWHSWIKDTWLFVKTFLLCAACLHNMIKLLLKSRNMGIGDVEYYFLIEVILDHSTGWKRKRDKFWTSWSNLQAKTQPRDSWKYTYKIDLKLKSVVVKERVSNFLEQVSAFKPTVYMEMLAMMNLVNMMDILDTMDMTVIKTLLTWWPFWFRDHTQSSAIFHFYVGFDSYRCISWGLRLVDLSLGIRLKPLIWGLFWEILSL